MVVRSAGYSDGNKAEFWLMHGNKWEFPTIRVPYFGVRIIRSLLFRVLYQGHLFSETHKSVLGVVGERGVDGDVLGASLGMVRESMLPAREGSRSWTCGLT